MRKKVLLLLAVVTLAFPVVVLAADAPIVLNQGMTGGPGVSGGHGNYDQTFAAVEITGATHVSGGVYTLTASDSNIPLSWEYYPGDTVQGLGNFRLNGSYDPTSGQVSGKFTLENGATGQVSGSNGKLSLTWSMTWTGEVTGTIEGEVAALLFSGAQASVCLMGGDDCSETGTLKMGVWFSVSGMQASPVPEDSGNGEVVVIASSAVGDVYFSPASEADLEPAQRTWHRISVGDRIALTDGVMLRTGSNGSLGLHFSDTSRMRLQPSTLFGVKTIAYAKTNQVEVYTRLYNGIMDFYMHKWAEDHKKFEVETDRAILTIQGTSWETAVTADATVITVAEGTVSVTDKTSGQTLAVSPGEQVTIDANGLTKTAHPTTVPPEEDSSPGASSGASDSAGASAAPAGNAPRSTSDPAPADYSRLVIPAIILVVGGLLLAVLLRWNNGRLSRRP